MCADIFGGVEPPRWLQEITIPKQQGETGSELGTILGGGLLALQQDPSTIDPATGKTKTDPETGKPLSWLETRKGFQRGLAEARMNQADPNWRVKEKALEANATANWARAASMWQQYNSTQKDMALWTTKDLPAITQFQEELKTNPEAVPPVVQSGKGMQAVGQLEKQQLAMQQARLRQDNAKINIENQKTSIAFDQAVSVAPVAIGSAIDELPNQGWNVDRQGKRTTPSTAALKIYNDWATGNGQMPEKAFGYKPNAVEVAKARGEESRKTEQTRGELKSNLEQQRQENRKELEAVKQSGRIDVEKLKQLGRVDAKGNPLGEKEFINRHFNTVWTTLRKNASDDETPAMTAAKAERILSGVYHRVDDRIKSDSAAPPPEKTKAPATKVDNTANEKDPLGLFSK